MNGLSLKNFVLLVLLCFIIFSKELGILLVSYYQLFAYLGLWVFIAILSLLIYKYIFSIYFVLYKNQAKHLLAVNTFSIFFKSVNYISYISLFDFATILIFLLIIKNRQHYKFYLAIIGVVIVTSIISLIFIIVNVPYSLNVSLARFMLFISYYKLLNKILFVVGEGFKICIVYCFYAIVIFAPIYIIWLSTKFSNLFSLSKRQESILFFIIVGVFICKAIGDPVFFFYSKLARNNFVLDNVVLYVVGIYLFVLFMGFCINLFLRGFFVLTVFSWLQKNTNIKTYKKYKLLLLSLLSIIVIVYVFDNFLPHKPLLNYDVVASFVSDSYLLAVMVMYFQSLVFADLCISIAIIMFVVIMLIWFSVLSVIKYLQQRIKAKWQ